MIVMHPHRRSLQFEHLESKASPTATFVQTAWMAPLPTDQVETSPATHTGFLEYVSAMLEEAHSERAIPSPAQTQAADHMLASELPPIL